MLQMETHLLLRIWKDVTNERGEADMNCKRCGAIMDEQNSFCPKCGKKATPENLNMKKKIAIGVIIGIILVGIILGGFVISRNRQQKEFSNRYEEFVGNCGQYKLGDCSDAYNKLCDEAEKAISQNDKVKFEEIENSFGEFEKELINYQDQLEKYANVEKNIKISLMLLIWNKKKQQYFQI